MEGGLTTADPDDDWALAMIDDVLRTAGEAAAALREMIASLALVRSERVAGKGTIELARMWLDPGLDQRRSVSSAFQAYEQSLLSLRARVIYLLVENEGIRPTDLAQYLGVSRQVVGRLYELGRQVGR